MLYLPDLVYNSTYILVRGLIKETTRVYVLVIPWEITRYTPVVIGYIT